MSDFCPEYVGPEPTWESWQHDYRFGVLLLFPPDPLRKAVNRLRQLYDPRSQSYCDAHISLTVPIPRPLTGDDWSTLRDVSSRIQPFALEYGPLTHYPPHPGVVLDAHPFQAIDQLRRSLEATEPFRLAPERRWPFKPHMTIAEFISQERTEELMIELEGEAPEGSYICDSVSLAIPDRTFRFVERGQLSLGE